MFVYGCLFAGELDGQGLVFSKGFHVEHCNRPR